MNSFLDVTANQRSSLNAHKNYSDIKQLSPKLTHTPLAQQSSNTNHTKTQSQQNGSNQAKTSNRRQKQNTYQSNGKKRNFSASHNLNLGVSNSVDNRQYQRVGNNSSSNHNATVSGKKGDKFQTKDIFDSTRSTNKSSSLSSNTSDTGSESSQIKSDRISRANTTNKSPTMDIRSARLMISHPVAHHNQSHMSLLSPNAKSIYSLDYLHQMGSQVNERYRTQQSEYYNNSSGNITSNGNRMSHSNERNATSRYNNNSNGNKYSNKPSTSNASASPPLSVTSSGSSTNSGKNNRGSKSYNFNSINIHRSIPTTPTIQQSHNGYFQSQSIPFFHSTSPNGMQQIFSSAMSPTNQAQHSNQSVGLYVQQNSSSFHPNNNYHSHNRNYHGNNNGNKKNWHYYGKSKSEANGNYCSSNSSTTSSTHSSGKTNMSKSTSPQQMRNESPPSAENATKEKDASDNLTQKRVANKSTQVESSPPDLKTFSLSDSETCNSKLKPMPPNDYFRFPKSKASSSPVISMNSPPLSSGHNSPNRIISHSFLSAIDQDTFKKSGITSDHHRLAQNDKSTKSSVDPNPLSFAHNQRSNFSMASRYMGTRSMLTEEMLLNGSLNTRLRYMNQQNMHLLSEPNAWATTQMGTTDYFLTSPSRPKNFIANVAAQQKRKSGTSLSAKMSRKFDFESQQAMQYRSRMSDIKVPTNLCNGGEYDQLSQKIWAKFDERRQPQELYESKILLWAHLCQQIKSIFSRYSLYLVGSTVSGFALDSSDVDMCLASRLSTNLDQRAEAVLHLEQLRAHLQENCHTFLKNFNLIPAKVPILRFDDTHHNIEVDLNYNNCVGIRNSHLLYCYTQLDWRLQPLAVIVKLWAQHHDINNAKDLTISSYSLILMVIHYLQCGVQPAILPCLHALYPDKFNKINSLETINMNDKIDPYHSDNNQTLGELFEGFLQYYCNFNYERFAISVRTAGLLPIEECRGHKSFKNDPTEWKQLCIEEPFDRSNTARSCCDEKIFDRIKKIFYESWHLLDSTKELDRLFGEPLAPPAFCSFYDNYTPIIYQQMDYILR